MFTQVLWARGLSQSDCEGNAIIVCVSEPSSKFFRAFSKGCRPSPQKRKRSSCVRGIGAPVSLRAEDFLCFEDDDFSERKLSMSNQFCATSTPVQDVYEVMLIMRAALIAGLKEVRDGSTDNLDGLILLAEDLTERLERAYEALEGSANQS